MQTPRINLDIEGTPVAIAGLAVAGIVAVAYSPIKAEARILAIGALGQLAGAAGGVAIPRTGGRARPLPRKADWGHSPATQPPEWGDQS